MRLQLAITGNLEKVMEEERLAAEKAITAGVRAAALGLKEELRQQVLSAGLGPRVARAWQSKDYPSGGRISLKAASLVYSKSEKIIDAFNAGKPIRSKSHVFLAIPTAACPKRGLGGKRISPQNFPEARYGKLRFVYRPGRKSLLVVDGLRQSKAGRFNRAGAAGQRTGNGLSTVVMFVLVPQVNPGKRLDFEGAAQRSQGRLAPLIAEHWQGPAHG